MFPGVTINNVKMKGSLNGEIVFDDICNTLSSPPGSCSEFVETKTSFENYDYEDWGVIVLVIILGGSIFGFLVLLY